MAFSNLIGVAIITTTATTLHANGKTNIETSAQAAEALRPLAGVFAETIFALGIIGTGLLAIPVLAGSTAYAIGEGRKWPVGLSRKPKKAVAFYAVLAVSVFLGIGLNFTPLDPIKALYWSAVVNGVLAPPVMVLLMLLVRKQKVMGKLVLEGWLYWLGWIATAAMALSIVGMGVSVATVSTLHKQPKQLRGRRVEADSATPGAGSMQHNVLRLRLPAVGSVAARLPPNNEHPTLRTKCEQ
jgi:Mn2+/Fe2+ NRAMP family transporter